MVCFPSVLVNSRITPTIGGPETNGFVYSRFFIYSVFIVVVITIFYGLYFKKNVLNLLMVLTMLNISLSLFCLLFGMPFYL